ncbi:MAG: DUF1064 domain-containing protein [Anaerolineales bacterium]|nr:DUF1064 domain-containing protein [Anaerolineales bacterium]
MVRQVRLKRQTKYHVDTSHVGKAARTVDGITFASKAEARRYEVLRARERVGEIQNLELQPQFALLSPFECRDERISGIRYTADFRYLEGGEVVVEEVKGRETRDFVLRRKLFLKRYGEQYRYKLVPSAQVLTYR